MQNQKPPSKGMLIASLAFFGLGGLLLGGVAIPSIGDDSSAVWVLVFGLLITLGTIAIAPSVFRGAGRQREEHEKQLKKHHAEDKAVPVHHQVAGGVSDFFSSIGSWVVIIVVLLVGFWAVRGAWHVIGDRINPPKWTGFFYYDPNNLDKYWTQSGFASLDDCRSWVNNQVSRDFDGSYDY